MDQLTPSSPGWSEWLGQLSGPEYISALKEAGLWKERPSDIPPPLSYEPPEMRDLNAPLEWWEDAGPAPDRLTIWDPQNANHSPFPSGFKIPKVDSITNARVKRYCHPFCSSERGSNERMNRMIRRFFPKGQSLKNVTNADCKRVQDWLNNYPRKILHYQTPAEFLQKDFPDLSIPPSPTFSPTKILQHY